MSDYMIRPNSNLYIITELQIKADNMRISNGFIRELFDEVPERSGSALNVGEAVRIEVS